eukprot:CAMPEP_0181366790 /NCGR_PEP_ID=MMETSP1106-20121128/10931_1 /TAXON_ID=81844 /ORGANISM="Mantoniella antarctica, Strain SL-175" /LENGTH=343 /DNA_ID=CAMNT_0023482241 /DNA_START=97 /DNA_END=1129 /DNA_ORIENTATION=+
MSATLAAFVFAALVAGAAACGDGESWAIAAGAKKMCCSPVAVKSFMYEVDGGIHDDNIKFSVQKETGTNFWQAGECDKRAPELCVRELLAPLPATTTARHQGDVSEAQILCVTYKCNNYVEDCNVDSFSATFYKDSSSSTPAPTPTPTPSSTPSSTSAPTPTPTPSSTPYSTPAPTPTPTPSSAPSTATTGSGDVFSGTVKIAGAGGYSVTFSGRSCIQFSVNSASEDVHVMLMKEINYKSFAANNYEGSYVYVEGAQCKQAYSCSKTIKGLKSSETYVLLTWNKYDGILGGKEAKATVSVSSCPTIRSTFNTPTSSGASSFGSTSFLAIIVSVCIASIAMLM